MIEKENIKENNNYRRKRVIKKDNYEERNEKVKIDVKNKLNKRSSLKVEFSNIDESNNGKQERRSRGNIFTKSKLKIIPLGGMNEIGKNMTVIEYENDIIVVDCGLAFPEDEMLGVDLVIPDFTYLEKNKDKVKALVITHGHEDHRCDTIFFEEEKCSDLWNKINFRTY